MLLLLFPLLVPLVICSLGFSLFPLPVKLDLYLGKPLIIKKGESTRSFSTRVQVATQKLIDTVQRQHVKEYNVLHTSKIWRYPFYSIYTLSQNICMTLCVLCCSGCVVIIPVCCIYYIYVYVVA